RDARSGERAEGRGPRRTDDEVVVAVDGDAPPGRVEARDLLVARLDPRQRFDRPEAVRHREAVPVQLDPLALALRVRPVLPHARVGDHEARPLEPKTLVPSVHLLRRGAALE